MVSFYVILTLLNATHVKQNYMATTSYFLNLVDRFQIAEVIRQTPHTQILSSNFDSVFIVNVLVVYDYRRAVLNP